MSTHLPQYQAITLNIQELQKNSLLIHDAVFKFSFKKIFPLSILYGKQNFERYTSVLQKIISELTIQKKFLKSDETKGQPVSLRGYYIKLYDYLQLLERSIKILSKVCKNLMLQNTDSSKFSIKEHNNLVKKYGESVRDYAALGRQLNESFAALKLEMENSSNNVEE